MYITEKYLNEKEVSLREDYFVNNVIYKLEIYKFENGNMWRIIDPKDDEDSVEIFTKVPTNINNLRETPIIGRTINTSNMLKLENTYRNIIDSGTVEFTNEFSNITLRNFRMRTINPNTELILSKPTGYKIKDGALKVFSTLGNISTIFFGISAMSDFLKKNTSSTRSISDKMGYMSGYSKEYRDLDKSGYFDKVEYDKEEVNEEFEKSVKEHLKFNTLAASISFLLPALSNFALRFIDSTLILKKIK